MKKRFAVRIEGDVQGVTFRYSARRSAEALHLSGFVRNDSDGSVHIEAEGDAGSLTDFIRWCRRGPDMARVSKITVTEIPVKGETGFSVI